MIPATATLRSPLRPRRGRWSVPLFFLVGAAMFAGLYCAPRGNRSPAAPDVSLGPPNRPLRVMAYNLYHNYRGIDATLGEMRRLQPPPEIVMLEEIEPAHVEPMSQALGLPHVYHPKSFRETPPIDNWPGVALMSRHPLYEGRPLRTADGAVFGVWAYAVVDGKKFAVAAVHLRATTSASPSHVLEMNRIRAAQIGVLTDVWEKAGRPPLVVGGDFNQPPFGGNYDRLTDHFTDQLGSIGKDYVTHRWGPIETRIDYLLATPEWRPVDGGVIDGEASDHCPIWVELRPATASPTTTAIK